MGCRMAPEEGEGAMRHLFVALVLVLWPGSAVANEARPSPREYAVMMDPCLSGGQVSDGPGESVYIDLRTAHGLMARHAREDKATLETLVFALDEADEAPLTLYLERMREPTSRYNWLTWRDDSSALVGCFSTTYEIRQWVQRHS